MLALQLWLPVLLRPVRAEWQGAPGWLYAAIAGGVLLWGVGSARLGRALSMRFSRIIAFLGFVTLAILGEWILTDSEVALESLGGFFSNAVLSVVMLATVRSVTAFMKWFAVVGFVVVLVYVSDPWRGYTYAGDYMTYGYRVMLPAILALLCYAWLRNRIRVGIVLSAAPLVLLTLFGNRLATGSAFLYLCIILIVKARKKPWLVVLGLLAVASTWIVVVIRSVDDWVGEVAELRASLGSASYSLDSLSNFLAGDVGGSVTTRVSLASSAVEEILLSPVVGHGLSHFQDVYGTYPHNIFLEIGVAWGFLGLAALVWLLVGAVRFVCSSVNRENAIVAVTMGLLAFPKLLFSFSLFQDQFVWLFLVMPFIFGFKQEEFRSGYRRDRRAHA